MSIPPPLNAQVAIDGAEESFGAENSWIIVASDVHHKWLPLVPDQSRGQ
ncbi:MAG: hypothetical protein OSA97_16990 [Nevskia sp.]|nr:hypothetical protein [Nevskia sp.]